MFLPDVAAHLWDLTQNALDAGADKITVSLHLTNAFVTLRLRDNGCGMTGRQKRLAMRRGYTTKPYSRGMGLPLARERAEAFALRSRKGRGTAVTVRFNNSVPAGDVYGTLALLQRVNPSVQFCVRVWESRTASDKF